MVDSRRGSHSISTLRTVRKETSPSCPKTRCKKRTFVKKKWQEGRRKKQKKRKHIMSKHKNRGAEWNDMVLFPGRRELASGLVVTGKTVDTGLDQNEAELSVAILAVALEMLADGDGLLDQVVEILGDLGGETVGLQDTEDLVTGDVLDLGNTLGVTEDDTDLGGGHTLLGELEDRVADILGGGLQPGRRRTLVGESGARDTLTTAVHATHFE